MLKWLAFAVFTVFRDVHAPDVPDVLYAIAQASDEHPLFTDPKRTAALLASVAWHESRFRIRAKGANHDCGAFQQVAATAAECELLRSDVLYAARVALAAIDTSMRACGAARMLNMYATGNCTDGQRVTDSRKARAEQLLRVKEPE
jgi:hypothetical protein